MMLGSHFAVHYEHRYPILTEWYMQEIWADFRLYKYGIRAWIDIGPSRRVS